MAKPKKHSKHLWKITGSSNIAQLSWASKGKQLLVLFHNTHQYIYEGVPLEIVKQVAEAESVGKAFGELIRPHYEGTKL